MPIRISDLEERAYRYMPLSRPRALSEARASHLPAAFLSHSLRDQRLAKGLQVALKEDGWEVHIDRKDAEILSKPNRTTATRLQENIRLCNWLLFLAAPNSVASHWRPREIEYTDGKNRVETMLTTPTSNSRDSAHGIDHLHLYKRIDRGTTGNLNPLRPNDSQGLNLRSLHAPPQRHCARKIATMPPGMS